MYIPATLLTYKIRSPMTSCGHGHFPWHYMFFGKFQSIVGTILMVFRIPYPLYPLYREFIGIFPPWLLPSSGKQDDPFGLPSRPYKLYGLSVFTAVVTLPLALRMLPYGIFHRPPFGVWESGSFTPGYNFASTFCSQLLRNCKPLSFTTKN